MQNFKLLARGIDVQPALAELAQHPGLWKVFTARQETPGSAHHDTECIVLRGPREVTIDAVFNDLDAHWLPYLAAVPELHRLVSQCVAPIGDVAKLGRVLVVNLKAGGRIDRHADEGTYAAHYERFHLVLQSAPGNLFACGGDVTHMQPGELWQFDHRTEHEVVNHSDEGRIHIIIDARRESGQEQ